MKLRMEMGNVLPIGHPHTRENYAPEGGLQLDPKKNVYGRHTNLTGLQVILCGDMNAHLFRDDRLREHT